MSDTRQTSPIEPIVDSPNALDPIVAAWRHELDGQVSVSATDVQDHLLALWGELPEGERRAEIERWLTETLARQLYAVDDIGARLDKVLAGA